MDLSFINLLSQPGEHSFLFQAKVGRLEAKVMVPESASSQFIAIIGHPHSLQGGTMQNKVVTTLARTFKELGIISLRFNFRGVGESQGEYDAGRGESEDMLHLLQICAPHFPQVQWILAGFSFGSYVAYQTALRITPAVLISVAPPVNHYSFSGLNPRVPWIIIQGDQDEIVPVQEVECYVKTQAPQAQFIFFAETGHFFHGKLIQLREALIQAISMSLSL